MDKDGRGSAGSAVSAGASLLGAINSAAAVECSWEGGWQAVNLHNGVEL